MLEVSKKERIDKVDRFREKKLGLRTFLQQNNLMYYFRVQNPK